MTPWMPADDLKIIELHKRLGPRWSSIASEFPGRTVSSIRNRFLRLQNGNKIRDAGQVTKNRCSKCGLAKKGHICKAKLAADQSSHFLSNTHPDALTGSAAPLLARSSSNASYRNTLANLGTLANSEVLTPATRETANWVFGENGLGDTLLSSMSDPAGVPVAQQLVDMSNESEPSARQPLNNDHLPVAMAVTSTVAPPSALPQHMLALVERHQSFSSPPVSLPVPSPRTANGSFQLVPVNYSSEDAASTHEAAAVHVGLQTNYAAANAATDLMFMNPSTTLKVLTVQVASDDERDEPSTPAAA